jgi:hypothetical protein
METESTATVVTPQHIVSMLNAGTVPVSPSLPICIFSSKSVPKISIDEYLRRIYSCPYIEESTGVIAMTYLDRVLRLPGFYLTSKTMHRMVCTSYLLAMKFHNDMCHTNAHFAFVGGITTKEMTRLEREFIRLCRFSLYVSPQEYETNKDRILNMNFQSS